MMFPITRRTLLRQSGIASAVISLPSPLLAILGGRAESVPPIEDPRLKVLADICLDAARQGGASYADVRLTHTFSFTDRGGDVESISIGVRTLVDGYWGFASSPIWSHNEAARLGTAAVRQAKANTLGLVRPVEFAPIPNQASGHWTMPIKDDPFHINRNEISDFVEGLRLFTDEYGGNRLSQKAPVYWWGSSFSFWKQEKAFASSEGQYCTQRLYQTGGAITLKVGNIYRNVEGLTPAGLGFEHIRDQPLRERIKQTLHEMDNDAALPVMPIDVGRYYVVFDAGSVANLVSQTIGLATEADRAFGYEANASGTSYITEPVEMLGTFRIGSKDISISGDRTLAGGTATVAWDDEGIAPVKFPLIEEGLLTNLQTSREGAGWIKEALRHVSQPFQSTGCMSAPEALYAPLIHSANLHLHPGNAGHSAATLCQEMETGLLFQFGTFDMDFQQLSGYGGGEVWKIQHGKKVAACASAGILFRTPELWKSVLQLGSADSVQRFGIKGAKGEPEQMSTHTVSTPPMLCKEITVIDRLRKA